MKTEPNQLTTSFNHTEHTEGNFSGLTKREYFAAMAMQGLIANAPHGNLHNSSEGSTLAIQWADNLIEALNKPLTT